jgi:hypothetical protein
VCLSYSTSIRMVLSVDSTIRIGQAQNDETSEHRLGISDALLIRPSSELARSPRPWFRPVHGGRPASNGPLAIDRKPQALLPRCPVARDTVAQQIALLIGGCFNLVPL